MIETLRESAAVLRKSARLLREGRGNRAGILGVLNRMFAELRSAHCMAVCYSYPAPDGERRFCAYLIWPWSPREIWIAHTGAPADAMLDVLARACEAATRRFEDWGTAPQT